MAGRLAQCALRRRHIAEHNSQGTYVSESAWSDGGSGASAFESEPAYQQLVQGTGKRSTPDVAYDADPNTGFAVYDSVNSVGWQTVGGTSAGAPQWAGLVAIADQGRVWRALALSTAPQTLTDLYQMAKSGGTAGFHQIGGSTYNTATGLGSPIGNQIIASLASTHTVEILQNAPTAKVQTEPNVNSLLIPATASRLLVSPGYVFTTCAGNGRQRDFRGPGKPSIWDASQCGSSGERGTKFGDLLRHHGRCRRLAPN